MQISMSLENFNVFVMMYLKAVSFQEIDHKKGLFKKIESSGNSEAILLFKDREAEIRGGRWDINRDREFNDQIHEMLPELDMKGVTEFDWFLDIMGARNIDDWLRQHYFRQTPEMRLQLRRFMDQVESDDDLQVRLII